jgi:hypothetical protein
MGIVYTMISIPGGGGKKQKSVNNQRRAVKRGGCGPLMGGLSPATFGDGDNLPSGPANYQGPALFGSKQVGGDGYGYQSGSALTPANVAGSYIPQTRYVAGGEDAARGGNNILKGGRRMRKSKRSGSKRSGSKRKSGGKRTCSGGKRSGSKRKTMKWSQKGCSTKKCKTMRRR